MLPDHPAPSPTVLSAALAHLASAPSSLRPDALRQLLCGEISNDELHQLLAILRADHDWQVLEPFAYPTGCLVQVAYRPTGQPLGFYAERLSPTRWRFAS